MRVILLLIGLLMGLSVNAATLKEKYRDENNDLICIYESHIKRVQVNVGFNGHCSFNVPDNELNAGH